MRGSAHGFRGACNTKIPHGSQCTGGIITRCSRDGRISAWRITIPPEIKAPRKKTGFGCVMNSNIQIVVNGESTEIPQGSGISALLLHLGLPNDRVAIERNLEILPRSQWLATAVQPGDRYEIGHLVGG